MIEKIENVAELITFREKRDNETQGEYIEYIKNEVLAGANERLNGKNAEIASLRTTIAQLESENANLKMEATRAERNQIDSQLTKTEVELRNVVEEIKSALSGSEIKVDSQDQSLSVILQKVNQLIEKYNEVEEEFRYVRSELDKPVNREPIQQFIRRQEELEKLIQRIYDGVNENKDQIIKRIDELDKTRNASQVQTTEVKAEKELSASVTPSITENNVQEVAAPEIDSIASPVIEAHQNVEPSENVLGSIAQNDVSDVPTFEHQTSEGELKVVSAEEAPQSTIDQGLGVQAQVDQSVMYTPTSTKMTRKFVDMVKAKTANIIKSNLKGQKTPYANIPQETIDRFDQNLVSQEEQTQRR